MTSTPRPQWTYFAPDGSYGDARGLIIIDTSDFINGDWIAVANADDTHRLQVAEIAGMSLDASFIPIDPTLEDIEEEEL